MLVPSGMFFAQSLINKDKADPIPMMILLRTATTIFHPFKNLSLLPPLCYFPPLCNEPKTHLFRHGAILLPNFYLPLECPEVHLPV